MQVDLYNGRKIVAVVMKKNASANSHFCGRDSCCESAPCANEPSPFSQSFTTAAQHVHDSTDTSTEGDSSHNGL